MFIKCDDLHLTNMEPLRCDKIYNTILCLKKNVYKQIASNCAKFPTNTVTTIYL